MPTPGFIFTLLYLTFVAHTFHYNKNLQILFVDIFSCLQIRTNLQYGPPKWCRNRKWDTLDFICCKARPKRLKCEGSALNTHTHTHTHTSKHIRITKQRGFQQQERSDYFFFYRTIYIPVLTKTTNIYVQTCLHSYIHVYI